MRDWRPRIIDVLRKPQKCPVCGERVVDIIYGTGDVTELEFLLEYRQDGIMGGDNIPRRPPIWACACGCKRFRKVNADGTDAPVKPKLLKNVRKKPMTLIIYYIGAGASYGIRKNDEIIEGILVVKEIPSEFDAFKRFIEKAEVPEGDIVFQDMCRTGHDDVENEKRYMLHDINGLIQGFKDHVTIDTYARKLYLTKRYHVDQASPHCHLD